MSILVKLPRKHAADWFDRLDGALDAEMRVVCSTERTITLMLDQAALEDLISDSLYFAEVMGPDNTGDLDYRPAARACLRGIDRAGIKYSASGFSVTLRGEDEWGQAGESP